MESEGWAKPNLAEQKEAVKGVGVTIELTPGQNLSDTLLTHLEAQNRHGGRPQSPHLLHHSLAANLSSCLVF